MLCVILSCHRAVCGGMVYISSQGFVHRWECLLCCACASNVTCACNQCHMCVQSMSHVRAINVTCACNQCHMCVQSMSHVRAIDVTCACNRCHMCVQSMSHVRAMSHVHVHVHVLSMHSMVFVCGSIHNYCLV